MKKRKDHFKTTLSYNAFSKKKVFELNSKKEMN